MNVKIDCVVKPDGENSVDILIELFVLCISDEPSSEGDVWTRQLPPYESHGGGMDTAAHVDQCQLRPQEPGRGAASQGGRSVLNIYDLNDLPNGISEVQIV